MHHLAAIPSHGQQSTTFSFQTEFEFLIACCSVDSNALRSARVKQAFKKKPDWSAVLRLGEYHSVLPQVYRATRDFGGIMPAATMDDLRIRYQNNARRNLQFTGELFRILDGLESHGILAIPYKGPVLAETVYGDLALREFSDLDVLVQPVDVLRAKVALRKLGYERDIPLTEEQERAYLVSGYEYTLDGPLGPNLLEIQWGILPRFYSVDFSMQSLFERARSSDFNGRRVRTLASEDLFLTLSVHAAKHAWIRLCWLRDIAGVMTFEVLDWDLVERGCRKLGIRRMVGVGVILAHDLLEAAVPDQVLQRWRLEPEIEAIARKIAVQYLAGTEEYNFESLSYFRLVAHLRERMSDKLRFWLRLGFTPGLNEWKSVSLPKHLFPLYRVIRLRRLAARILRSTP